MQPPPFESPSGPVKKKSSALPWIIIGGVLVCCVGPIAVIGGGGYYAARQALPIGECQIAFRGLGTALGKYADANGGKLPKAESWQTDIAKYYDAALPTKDETGPLTIPRSNEPLGCGTSPKTAVAFNTAYSGKVLADIKDKDAILVFETTGTPEINKSAAYKDPGKAAAPKIFGNPRGWFAVNAGLDDVIVVDGRQTNSGASAGAAGRRSRAGAN